MSPELLTHEELAALLRSTPNSGYAARVRGIEPWSLGFKVGRKVLYRSDEIDAWLDERAREAQEAREARR